jgi:hypothetical protein
MALMRARLFVPGAAALALLALTTSPAQAERVRYHFAATDICGSTTQTPAGQCNAIGERVAYFGLGTSPYSGVVRPNYLVTLFNPVTRGTVTVPLALPEGTPQMRHGRNRLIFDYGTYQVEVVFLPDGSVDVYYDSGWRRLQ